MIKSVKINYEALGAEFANASDEDQALFFTGLANEMRHWQSEHHKQMQGAMVSDKLRDDVKKELETFLGMLWFNE